MVGSDKAMESAKAVESGYVLELAQAMPDR